MDLEHQAHHIVSPRVYLLVFGTLLVCTVLTAGVAFIDLGIWNPVIALAIACFKASLVVLFFMHIHYSSKLLKLTVVSGLFIFLVLITMTLSDYISRAWGMW
ncbi:MAG TPA: cytochrome C oxidase subunit IV family protein [Acidobacteriaceae bacterium]|nr:cytochrome C oxidase subunit IV family protein [Acidobacteriaceae bacterium]